MLDIQAKQAKQAKKLKEGQTRYRYVRRQLQQERGALDEEVEMHKSTG
jgi:hypothetical protein